MVTKKTKKTIKFKPVFEVNFSECDTVEDAYMELLDAKLDANLPLKSYEVDFYSDYCIIEALDAFVDDLFDGHNAVILEDGCLLKMDAYPAEEEEKKQKPWYTKIFGWLK